MESFWRRGYDGSTFDSLVKDSKLSRSSLYNSFGNKDELFELAHTVYLEQVQEGTFRKFESEHAGEEALRAMLRSLKEPFDRRSNSCLVLKTMFRNASHSGAPKQVSSVRYTLSRLWRAFSATIRRIQKGKEVYLSDDERASLLIAAMFGTALICRNGNHPELVESIASSAEKLLDLADS